MLDQGIKVTKEEKETLRKILTTEVLRLLTTSLKFQDKSPYSYNILKFAGIYDECYTPWKQRVRYNLKLSLVSGLLLDLIVNKPEIIVSMVADLYENHLNLLKEGKIDANKRFNSYLAKTIKFLVFRGPTFAAYRLIDNNIGNFIYEVCESLLQKNTNDLIKTVEKYSNIVIEMLLKDFDSFEAYMEFLRVYSCVLEALNEIYILSIGSYETILLKPEHVLKILEFYKKYYEKLYSELQLWQKLFDQNVNNDTTVIENTPYISKPRKESNFAFAFTIYYLITKTIECVAKASLEIRMAVGIRTNDTKEKRELKLKSNLDKLIIDYLVDTYVHFCENVLLEPWREGSKGEGIYRYFVLPSTPARKTVAATLLEPTYKLIHKELEFDLLYNSITKNNPNNPYKEYKQKIYEIVTCKSIIDRWIDCLFHNNNLIWEAKFEKR
jgi:hypothetical protein